MTALLWLVAGGIISWFIFGRPKRDFYIVELVTITGDAGGKLSDIEFVAGSVARYRYDLTPNGSGGYAVRLKGQKELFAVKSFDIFDDHAAARQKFDNLNNLFMNAHSGAYVAHRVFLWVVTARNRADASSRIVKSAGTPRKIMETDYPALLKMYRPEGT
jgi:hypothetical protein